MRSEQVPTSERPGWACRGIRFACPRGGSPIDQKRAGNQCGFEIEDAESICYRETDQNIAEQKLDRDAKKDGNRVQGSSRCMCSHV